MFRASQGGLPDNPQWYDNLKADPEVEMRVRTEVSRRRAREITDPDERARIWRLAVRAFPAYQDYQAKTQRQIPVFLAELVE